ncbi:MULTISPECIES: TIGR04283 family arsenosugar biosynthesis glycosyltransferase [unclassified Imperialibacter]|uniref:TIGR04283 family arsenosugar biosynthesis glycosyltransferase n=1 Tax=unclassified Imperialibacter TaxID=2629706 RepID=UPI00125C25F0|nr:MULTISPECIES: TIGR04283 family arsenosugar biosynthesis glycosyltransferase [unclassified Imperialibacter]CAD5247763.1 Glycosyl transferase [Imperialibacter sp. 75]CAD5247889.1 Glycosyl transferase [Imperialibacter sp. 89]VVS97155.1 Glycosyl transferase [Imperialibacter sp. EC-SDR9]
MTISVIIPTYNEEQNIVRLIESLKRHGDDRSREIIVVDGGSSDATARLAAAAGAVVVKTAIRRRSVQMNLGAEKASGDVLYFVHADVVVEPDYVTDISQSLSLDYESGCYRYRFNSNSVSLRINAFFTRFPFLWCRGGDQTLFITKELFWNLGGFQEDYRIMEDYDIIERIKKKSSFRVIPREIVVSARKYDANSYLRVQFANFLVFSMYFWGASQHRLTSLYKKLLKTDQ